jgi:hypothetical protein
VWVSSSSTAPWRLTRLRSNSDAAFAGPLYINRLGFICFPRYSRQIPDCLAAGPICTSSVDSTSVSAIGVRQKVGHQFPVCPVRTRCYDVRIVLVRALVLTRRPAPGTLPDVVQMMEVPKPVPRRGEVLVKVQASTINIDDIHVSEGTFYASSGVTRRVLIINVPFEKAQNCTGVERWRAPGPQACSTMI